LQCNENFSVLIYRLKITSCIFGSNQGQSVDQRTIWYKTCLWSQALAYNIAVC